MVELDQLGGRARNASAIALISATAFDGFASSSPARPRHMSVSQMRNAHSAPKMMSPTPIHVSAFLTRDL